MTQRHMTSPGLGKVGSARGQEGLGCHTSKKIPKPRERLAWPRDVQPTTDPNTGPRPHQGSQASPGHTHPIHVWTLSG